MRCLPLDSLHASSFVVHPRAFLEEVLEETPPLASSDHARAGHGTEARRARSRRLDCPLLPCQVRPAGARRCSPLWNKVPPHGALFFLAFTIPNVRPAEPSLLSSVWPDPFPAVLLQSGFKALQSSIVPPGAFRALPSRLSSRVQSIYDGPTRREGSRRRIPDRKERTHRGERLLGTSRGALYIATRFPQPCD